MVKILSRTQSSASLHRFYAAVAGLAVSLLYLGVGLSARAEEAPLPDSPGAVQAQQGSVGPASGAQTTADKRAEGQQSKRIFGIIPNFRSVSVDDNVPMLTPNDKFKLALKNSFDYTTFITVAGAAGISQARDSYPEFHQGALGYGRRYWHSFTNQAVGNMTTVFLMPVITREDPRYYTLGKGTVMHRGLYAVSRLAVTRKDSGEPTANISEIVGRGAEAGISMLYYPSKYHTFSEVGQNWAEAIALDALAFGLKEFYPDIRYKLTGGKK